MSLKASAGSAVQQRSSYAWALPALLLVGFVLRLLFIQNEGFKTDVNTFIAWATMLADRGFGAFYTSSSFADYPPGYFYVLGFIGWVWELLFRAHDPNYAIIRAMVKLPAILADIGVGALIYAIVRRFAASGIALAASTLYVLNPAVIVNSALWGQVDAVSAGLALLAIYFLLRSDDVQAGKEPNWWIVGAWLVFGYSLLIKPQAAVIAPLMIAFAFVGGERTRSRLISTGIGVVSALVLAIVLTEPFYPSNPIAAIAWLLQHYASAASVYPDNSVNAFNLWSIRGKMWQPDSDPVAFGNMLSLGPQRWWGLLLLAAALVLTVWRYVQARTPRALIEGCAIATIAFFMLATRMHERYLFDGLLFAIVCLPFAARYLWGALGLTAVLFANLMYGLQYLHVVGDQVPGYDTTNLWGIGTTLISMAGVLIFFWLGYMYLGGDETAQAQAPERERERGAPVEEVPSAVTPGSRHWFDPREGLAALRWPLDYAIMGLTGLSSFVLSFVGYWWPPDKVFDEIYFARAAEEYLQNMRIYENTHPPLSKLMITFSVMLFGGMPHGHGLGGWPGLNAIIGHMPDGDNSYGWRFLDVVFGALVVMLLYAFAKRITGSTIFATICALFLTADGMHFVQSRIATPEGIVVFFATLVTYAFYRFWIGSQVADRAHIVVPAWAFAAAAGGSILLGFLISLGGWNLWGASSAPNPLTIEGINLPVGWWTVLAGTAYFGAGLYLLVRYAIFPRVFADGKRELSYGEGSFALRDDTSTMVYAADGGTVDGRGKVRLGVRSQNKQGALVYNEAPLSITYRKDASVTYATPEGEATFEQDEVRSDAGTDRGSASKFWLVLFTVALGALVSSKWYGVMGFGVSFIVLIAIFLQRYLVKLRPLVWGNPRGFRIDGALMTILFVSMTIYALAWVPDLLRHSTDPNEIHNVNDVTGRQYSMFMYHDTLKATHPYASWWYEWPIDYVPVAYFYQDHRKNQQDNNDCCIYEITSMPNPVILWAGIPAVLIVAFLAWREKKKGYLLIVLTYLLQWLPWMRSPRITFAYHFYVDIPLICLCLTIVLQRIWEWGRRQEEPSWRWMAGLGVAAFVAVVLGMFVYFYPILAAHPISWNDWNNRMWFKTWVIGPG